jgi:large subunit ribosomal protein L23|uniref:Large ribosomal subunit protein uL23c n=3 Tax=Heterosigma akashiwo TaxID=2829 RepID=A0A224ANT2_HETAK|nr:50S ribosomal protein L2 [Heterosigma akashiwo]BBA18396.1 50S ribosomal protein L2 [Heterosigma akashiwo]BBA18535.1 50S ribosomal protein L2 [Heterosigma akashiwo]BBA18673.1 50S ribosomal protein L2 [Heterosigma akashiwo]BBA18812.1 50S ribosomal protein L2 [Heterosigma akashiwo]|mmetsp:Transcript_19614/g.29687  ORF Transcript_19614/g.29687 Transcript_19614/m.29687 type:complete len:102 (-) Transcript_19614:14299-14604(-)
MVKHKYMGRAIDAIKYPIITEKSTSLFEKNQYTFVVDRNLDKEIIKKTIELLFNVKVTKINTSVLPKKKRRLGKYIGYKPNYKKAIVKLASGDTIQLFPDV